MAKERIEKGEKLICIWCGREVLVTNYGMYYSTLLCCGRPMKKKNPSFTEKSKEKVLKKEE